MWQCYDHAESHGLFGCQLYGIYLMMHYAFSNFRSKAIPKTDKGELRDLTKVTPNH